MLALTQCGKRDISRQLEKPSSRHGVVSRPYNDSIFGTWTDSKIMFAYSHLEISKNHTFSYHFGGCLGGSYTEGTWIRVGGTVVLTSYDKYKEVKPAEPAMSFHDDSAKFFLDHATYRLVGDTLYRLGESPMCSSSYWRPREYPEIEEYDVFLLPNQYKQ